MTSLLIRKCRFIAMRFFLIISSVYIPVGWCAGFGIDATRVILQQRSGTESVSIRNTSETPYLVRSVVLDDEWKPVKGLAVNPSVVRLDANGNAVLRVVYSPEMALPQDRESVFYFHSTVVASGAQAEQPSDLNNGAVKIAMGTRIKLFVRPPGISAPKKETFAKLVISKEGEGIKVDNPTPYYVTLVGVTVDDHKVEIPRDSHMVAPFGSQTYALSEKLPMEKVVWSIINDVGGEVSYRGAVKK